MTFIIMFYYTKCRMEKWLQSMFQCRSLHFSVTFCYTWRPHANLTSYSYNQAFLLSMVQAFSQNPPSSTNSFLDLTIICKCIIIFILCLNISSMFYLYYAVYQPAFNISVCMYVYRRACVNLKTKVNV